MHNDLRTTILLDGLTFPEGPRWREDRLWFSDFFSHRVMTVDLQGHTEVVAEVPGQPSGLGWTPDGRLLVVSMTDRRLLGQAEEGLVEVADLSALAPWHCNDMVVDATGSAWIGNFGFEYRDENSVRSTVLIRVDPDGTARVAADGLYFPNGMVITPDGNTLIVAETFAARLTAFTIATDGSLTDRRTWAELPGKSPDGICLDADGAVWVASPPTREVMRVFSGGEIAQRVVIEDNHAIACMLGGAEGRTLFVLTGRVGLSAAQAREHACGRIEMVEVETPGAGLP